MTNKRTALITGGTSGIGRATARLLAEQGVDVIVTGRNSDALQRTADDLSVTGIRSDTADLADIDALVERIGNTVGRLDLLFLNAGIPDAAPVADTTPDLFDRVFAVNVRGPFFTAQRLAPLIPAGGSIVVTTSVDDRRGLAGSSVYGASKAALRSLVRTLAREYVSLGIRVNAVSPGPIETGILERNLGPEAAVGARQQMIANNPMGRFGSPDEVARAVAYLAFDATFTTGAELTVDGGVTQL